jgi:hypothetical protein
VHLPEVGGKLGLLVATAGDYLVRRHHLAPGLQATRHRPLDRVAGSLALFSQHACSSNRIRSSEEGRRVPLGDGLLCVDPIVTLITQGFRRGAIFEDVFELALDEWAEAGLLEAPSPCRCVRGL